MQNAWYTQFQDWTVLSPLNYHFLHLQDTQGTHITVFLSDIFFVVSWTLSLATLSFFILHAVHQFTQETITIFYGV